jgi:DnaJ-class molecular chaperone
MMTRAKSSTKFKSKTTAQKVLDRAYETLSDQTKKDAYDQQMGFGRSQFQDMHFSSQQARQRSGVFSDDEYENINPTDRRSRPKSNTEGNWSNDARAGQKFWEDTEARGAGGSKGGPKHREDFARKVWDEFDDFFDFNDNDKRTESARDETKGGDYKADLEITLDDAFKGVKTVS